MKVLTIWYCIFLSTPSGWRATRNGGDAYFSDMTFLSTPSGWRATRSRGQSGQTPDNFYPRPPGGGRPLIVPVLLLIQTISIHALRVEGDLKCMKSRKRRCISIHALRVEGDICPIKCHRNPRKFLSTPSGWRATIYQKQIKQTAMGFLSTPSGWRATYADHRMSFRLPFLSTPSGWRATFPSVYWGFPSEFLSTPSGWRATFSYGLTPVSSLISIHALRVEGDWTRAHSPFQGRYFYPRPPGGGRRRQMDDLILLISISIHALRVEGDFQGRISWWAACGISIHALRVEGDCSLCLQLCRRAYFYPRPPGGGRRWERWCLQQLRFISIHALRVEGDHAERIVDTLVKENFYPRPPGGGRRKEYG